MYVGKIIVILTLTASVYGHKPCSSNANLMKSIQYQLKLVEQNDGTYDSKHKVTVPTRGDYERLHEYLVNISGPGHLIPRYDKVINVQIYMGIIAIQDYHEVSSILTITAIFWLIWTDDTKQWNVFDYGGIDLTDMPIEQTWTPKLSIQNGIDRLSIYAFDDSFDTGKTTVGLMFNGAALATIRGRYRVICEPDVTFYPADEHKCTMVIIGLDYLVTLSSQNNINLDGMLLHDEWSIIDTYTRNTTICTAQFPTLPTAPCYAALEFTIILKREYMFSLLNIIVPIVIVSFVHIFVFLLPIESGERTSFAITLLLTLIVFMSTVTEYLPASSNISVINIFLLHQLVASVFTTFLAVTSIQLFHKDPREKNKGILFGIVACLFKLTCKRRSAAVNHADYDKEFNEIPDADTCRNVSICFDKMCFWLQCFCYIASYVAYAIYILL